MRLACIGQFFYRMQNFLKDISVKSTKRFQTFPTYRSIFPGAPPTYPKSASAISPGPFTMQPMIAIWHSKERKKEFRPMTRNYIIYLGNLEQEVDIQYHLGLSNY